MITIEQKPIEPEQIRLEESPRKGRKNDGLGGFAKLLAGLVSKKTLLKAGAAGEAGAAHEAGAAGETGAAEEAGAAGIAGKTGAFRRIAALTQDKEKAIRLAGGKQRQAPAGEDDVSAIPLKGKKQAEIAEKNRQNELDALHFIRLQAEKADRENGLLSEQVLLKNASDDHERITVERRFPFRSREKPETSADPEARIADLNPGLRSKKEAVLPADNEQKTKKTERRKDKISVEVIDLRTQTGSEAGVIAEQGLKGAEEIRNHTETVSVVDLRPVGERSDSSAWEASAGTENKTDGENFAQVLARELNGELSADIVKQAAVILRDGGEGTIRLSLKPESLGKVKIHLEMAENKILGHIVVESEEALRAFEQEIHTLEQAFKDSGFEASLNAALDYRNDGQRWQEKEAPAPFFSERLAAVYEDSAEPAELSGAFNFGFGLSAVNMLV